MSEHQPSNEIYASGDEPKSLGIEPVPASAKLWDDWFSEGNRTLEDVYRLFEDQSITSPTLRQRAVTTLTAPRTKARLIPYARPSDGLPGLLTLPAPERDGPRNLYQRLTTLRQVQANELGFGILWWMEHHPNELLHQGPAYATAIQSLLRYVEPEVAERLFNHHPVQDLRTKYSPDSPKGYQPAKTFIFSPHVPEKYKERMLDTLLHMATEELSGRTEPISQWDHIEVWLGEIMELWTHEETSRTQVVSRVTRAAETLESLLPQDSCYVKGYYVTEVAKNITDEEVLYKFLRRHVIAKGNSEEETHFEARNSVDASMLHWLTEEAARQNDTLLSEVATVKLERFEAQTQQAAAEIAAKHAAQTAFLKRMRAAR